MTYEELLRLAQRFATELDALGSKARQLFQREFELPQPPEAGLFLLLLSGLLIILFLGRELSSNSRKKKSSRLASSTLESESPLERGAPESPYHRGLKKTRAGFFDEFKLTLAGVGDKGRIDDGDKLRLRESLIKADVGIKAASQLIEDLDKQVQADKARNFEDLIRLMSLKLSRILSSTEPADLQIDKKLGRPHVVLIVGVNGAGKTTSIAKLGCRLKANGLRVMFAACDTFRAAAGEQLSLWADRLEISLVEGEKGAKPSTVAYQALEKARAEKVDVLLVDTAGRLHTKKNLMAEVKAVAEIIGREFSGAPDDVLLVLDGTSGQNALEQARQFASLLDVSGVIITKLDGTSKGGIVVAITQELGLPLRFLGLGEGQDDLLLFDPELFSKALLGAAELVQGESEGAKANKRKANRTRRRTAAA